MEVLQQHTAMDGQDPAVADFSGQVLVALERLSREERESVLATVWAFAKHELEGTRLSSAEPLYLLQAAPEVLVIARREAEAPVEVEDIVRPATLRNFAHAR